MNRVRIIAGTAAAGLLAGGALWLAVHSDGHVSPTARPHAAPRTKPPLRQSAMTRTPAERLTLSILRRRVTVRDRIPPEALPYFGPRTEFGRGTGVDLRLARRVRIATNAAWLLPARHGRLCLIINTYEDSVRVLRLKPSYVTSCGTRRDAAAGRFILTMTSGTPSALPGDHRRLLVGIVPDGVKSVTLALASGVPRTVAPAENVYWADIGREALLSAAFTITSPDGHETTVLRTM